MNFRFPFYCLSMLSLTPVVSMAVPAAISPEAAVPAASSDVDAAIERMYPALVRIYVVMEEGADGRMKKMQGAGSGSIISTDGYVLTNHHVAGRGTRFVCTLSDREEVDATLVGTDALADLAVIKLDLSTRRIKDQPLAVATFGDSDRVKVGDVVLAMGCPGGLSQSITRGIVANRELISSKFTGGGMKLDGEPVGELVRWIGHDAVIFGGNSGGPLVNLDGQIIGINEVGIASLGGAIPSNLAKKVADELIKSGHVTRSWIGLEAQPLLRGMTDGKGALVATVWKDSPAAKAGIEAGDFITEYNGSPVIDCHAEEDLPLFNAMVLNTAPGIKVTVKGIRNGKLQTWQVTTVVREPNLGRESETHGWAFTARDLTTVSSLEQRRDTKDGVLIDTVRTGGASAEAKPALRGSDIITKVNGKPVKNLAELNAFTAEFTKGAEGPKPVLVEFERGREKLATVVKVGPEIVPHQPQVAEKPWFGAATQVITDELATALGIPGKKGVRITVLSPDSPATKAGLKEGDLLLKLDGRVIAARRVEDSEVFPELILANPVDATIELEGMRDGQPHKWSVPLAARPQDDSELTEFKDDLFEFTARSLSSAQIDEAKVDHGPGKQPQGVAVSKIVANGWAALGGLLTEDVILRVDGADVNDIESFKKKLLGYRETKPRSISLEIQRGPRTAFIELEPRW